MFQKNKELYCEPCSKKNKDDYGLIIAHIKENPGATIMEVITATGTTLKSINCFIEDGSISYVENNKGRMIDIPKPVEVKKSKFHTRRR